MTAQHFNLYSTVLYFAGWAGSLATLANLAIYFTTVAHLRCFRVLSKYAHADLYAHFAWMINRIPVSNDVRFGPGGVTAIFLKPLAIADFAGQLTLCLWPQREAPNPVFGARYFPLSHINPVYFVFVGIVVIHGPYWCSDVTLPHAGIRNNPEKRVRHS